VAKFAIYFGNITKIQLINNNRSKNIIKARHPALVARPQLGGIVIKVAKANPRKPCSANRAVCKIKLKVTKKALWCFLPGDDKSQASRIATPHKLVLIQGGGPRDLPGVHYKIVRGWPSQSGVLHKILEPPRRYSRRAKYGIKNRLRLKRTRLKILIKRCKKKKIKI